MRRADPSDSVGSGPPTEGGRLRKLLIALPVVCFVVLGSSVRPDATADAAPSQPANCVAVLTSFFGPQGQVDNAVHTLQALAAARGMTFGELAGILVREQGTVDECFALLGLPPAAP